MKKILFAAAALVAFAACTNDDVVSRLEGPAIAFDNAFVENSTRAAQDLSKDNLANFGVYGSVTKDSNVGMIFRNTPVTKNGDAYTYSPAQYWVDDATYNFVALAPHTNAKWNFNTSDAKSGFIAFDNEAAAGEQDLLFASANRTTASITSAPAPVAFTFNHMLSRVKFSFTNGFVADSNIELKVTDVKIVNAHKTGELQVVDGVVAQDWFVADNAVAEYTFVREFGNLDVAKLAEGGNGETDHYYLIPANAEYTVTFDVEIFQAGVSLKKTTRQAVVSLDMAKGYSYNVKATLNDKNASADGELYPIEFTVDAVEDWADYTDVEAKPSQIVSTPAEFVNAIADGGMVVLDGNIELPNTGVTVTKKTTIDLNGKALTVVASNFVNESTLTVTNGTISGVNTQAGRRGIVNKGNLTMENVTVKQVYAAGGSAINNDGTNAVAVLNNVTVVAENMAVSNKNGAKMTINGGSYVGRGKPETVPGYAIVNQLGSHLVINGGAFEGGHGVVSCTESSEAILNAGTYNCTNTYDNGTSNWVLHVNADGRIVYNKANCTFVHPSGASRYFCVEVSGEIVRNDTL